ncbi:4Fe-4S dicluster domain-containing protein [Rufibacter radiotolerans]|uniref:4Fe-4S dicluster domain-containing protein n=1 Tax=Rufibacter radiotolerans TaxID=1379910 RepID=UPI00097155A4|nr:4Fe-4S dicluster domain-containing protein [Rufibacter radiotolerans]
MALIITDECINCDACISKCPNNAISEPDAEWSFADGTTLRGLVKSLTGADLDADAKNAPLSDEFYFIVSDKCTECHGFHEKPQCASVCPVDCCIVDDSHIESEDQLLLKKVWMHGE